MQTYRSMRFGGLMAAFLFLTLGFLLALPAHAKPPSACAPTTFSLSGSNVDNLWKQVTNNQWSKMLPIIWQDNGFHFYARVRERGPDAGINTPSDLESEIRRGTPSAEGTPNRWQITLPVTSSTGRSLRVIYDYAGGKNAKCELVTLSY
ncbi:hypothetical protein [Thalassospira profundimaris]|uniref:hypothetical protein n=1 Tax=Thalassospira profundimaris TaxID=502049 RepID=UPI0002871AE2|nr:hypothetical protein [Thalassospira profundimaris]EKF08340.1 hypothetical protein TH2_09484 [Thalassospira profundimaris WP0211]